MTEPTTHQRKHSKLQSTYELKLTPCLAVECDLSSKYIAAVENLQTLRKYIIRKLQIYFSEFKVASNTKFYIT